MLLSSGIDFKTAFELLQDNFNKKNEKKLIKEILDSVMEGSSISETLEKTKDFTLYEVYSIKIGEETGRLSEVLKELSTYYKKRIEQRRKIVSAFSYPLFVLMTAFGAIFFMMQFIVPMFEDVFLRFNNDLPAITQFMIDVSHGFKKYFLVFLLIIISVGIFIYFIKDNLTYKRYSSTLILRIPIFGQLLRQINLARFCLSFELLLSSKISILKAVQLVKKMIVFYPISSALNEIEEELLKGTQFHICLSKFDIFDKRLISMIKVAEEVNQLDTVFNQLKEQYNSDVAYKTENLNNVLEPLLIIFIGVFVGLILISMYLPMFKMSTGAII